MLLNKVRSLLDEDFKETLSKGFWAGALLGLAAILQFVFNFFIARLLGPEQTGNFFIAFTTISILGIVSRIGLDQAAVRFSAPLHSQERFAELKGFNQLITRLVLVTSGFLAIILFFSAPVLANHVFNNPDVANHLRIGAVALPLFSFSFLFTEVLRGFKRIKAAVAVKHVFTYGTAIIFFLLFINVFESMTAIIAFGVGSLVAAVTGWLLIKNFLPEAEEITPFRLKKLLVVSFPLLAVAVSSQVMQWSDVLILGAFTPSESVGIYSIVLQAAVVINFALIAINTIAAPKFAELYHTNKHKELASLVQKITWLMVFIGMPLLLFFLLFPEFILSLFGQEFIIGATALIIVALGQYVKVAVGSVGYLLAMTGYEKVVSKVIVLAAILNIILNFMLIPRYGMNGAAISTAVCVAINNVALLYFVHKKLKISVYSGKLIN